MKREQLDLSPDHCAACRALADDWGEPRFVMYARKLFIPRWAGTMTEIEREFKRAHSPRRSPAQVQQLEAGRKVLAEKRAAAKKALDSDTSPGTPTVPAEPGSHRPTTFALQGRSARPLAPLPAACYRARRTAVRPRLSSLPFVHFLMNTVVIRHAHWHYLVRLAVLGHQREWVQMGIQGCVSGG
jgi:hypothetical protein